MAWKKAVGPSLPSATEGREQALSSTSLPPASRKGSSGLSLQHPEAGALSPHCAEYGSSLVAASSGPVPGARLFPSAASAFSCIPVPLRLPLLPLGKVWPQSLGASKGGLGPWATSGWGACVSTDASITYQTDWLLLAHCFPQHLFIRILTHTCWHALLKIVDRVWLQMSPQKKFLAVHATDPQTNSWLCSTVIEVFSETQDDKFPSCFHQKLLPRVSK